MSKEYTQAEADQHNALTEAGWAILNDYILLHEREDVRIGFFAKRRLQKAVGFFQEALRISPDNYSSKWALDKIYQVLENHKLSLKWFEEAWALERDNIDVCREASLAALECGRFSKALFFSDKAVEVNPGDAGIHCNRALVLMFLNRDADAIEAVDTALKIDPEDQISVNVKDILHSVANGKRPRPRTIEDI